MSDEQDPLKEPMIEKLSSFTPSAAGMNRDELFFQMGRASNRLSRVWKGTVAVLLLTQVTTLAGWVFSSREYDRAIPLRQVENQLPAELPLTVTPSSEPLAQDSYGALIRQWDQDRVRSPESDDPRSTRLPSLTVASGYQNLGLE